MLRTNYAHTPSIPAKSRARFSSLYLSFMIHMLYFTLHILLHIHTGDSEIDGNESERGGFMGHPVCEIFHTPFFGDNELYTYMSTEHFTCHMCQRQHPGQFEYYKNYDDLEL